MHMCNVLTIEMLANRLSDLARDDVDVDLTDMQCLGSSKSSPFATHLVLHCYSAQPSEPSIAPSPRIAEPDQYLMQMEVQTDDTLFWLLIPYMSRKSIGMHPL